MSCGSSTASVSAIVLFQHRGSSFVLFEGIHLGIDLRLRFAGFVNKQMLAELIAKHIPAFERYVPPPRKPWKSEDARMGIFDAAALALVFFQKASAEATVK